MKRPFIKRILIAAAAVAILVSLLSLLIFYMNHTFIPVRLKGSLVERLTENTGHIVELDSLQFSLRKGFLLEGLRIYEDINSKEAILFKADTLSARVFLIPSFKKQRVIIPSVGISGFYLNLERSDGGSWNIASLLKGGSGSDKGSRVSIIIKGLSFSNGRMRFKDNFNASALSKKLTGLKGSTGLALPDSFNLRCEAFLDGKPLRITAVYKIRQKELSLKLKCKDVKITDYSDTYLPEKIGSVNNGTVTAELKIDAASLKSFELSGTASIKGLNAYVNDTHIEGDYSLKGDAGFDAQDISKAKYSLRARVDNAKARNKVKLLDSISDIKGTLNLTREQWEIEKASCLCYGSLLEITGNVKMPHADFVADINLSSTMLLKNISEDVDITIENGRAKIEANLVYRRDGSYKITGSSDIESLKLIQKDIGLSGNFLIKGQSGGTAGNWQASDYKGSVDFDEAAIQSAGRFPLISDAAGTAQFNTKSIIIKKLTGACAGTEISLNGKFDYAQDKPAVSLHLKSDKASVSRLIQSLPDNIKARFYGIDAKGVCLLDIDFKGILDNPESYDYSGTILLEKSSLKLEYWPYEISDIDCGIDFKKQQLIWKDLSFDIDGIRYSSYGQLSGLTEVSVSAAINSNTLNAVCSAKKDKNGVISISKLDGSYRDSSFSLNGTIKDIRSAYADLKGEIYLKLQDTPYIFTRKSEALKKLKPRGTIKLGIEMQGPLKKPPEWTLFAEASSETIGISGFTLNDFYADYRMKDYFIDIPVMSAYAYNGIININSRSNLKTRERPYIINIDIKDMDLQELIKDTDNKDRKIKGLFACKAVLNGYLDKKDSLRGNGWLQVSDGYLWEFPVVHGIMNLILMIPPENIVLTDAFGNFSIGNNRIYTQDFKMLSKAASLLWAGSLGFDGTLDFNITGRFAENVVKQTTEPGRIANAILHKAGNLIMEVRLTGTLKKPVYQIVPFPLQRIFEEKVVDRLNDIFGNIGE